MKTQGKKRQMVGTVMSNKMDKTVIVLVERLVKHGLYKKYIRRTGRFAAHDNDNACNIGDKVMITEIRPLSRTKKWRVSSSIEKAL